jgi:16S rRNA (guanine966-N2)-methyltransferase
MTPVRITAGSLRGRRLASPIQADVRPTPSKVREALFNILGDIAGWRVLDLFAGSGLMALEAISRGAAATSVEQRGTNCRAMQAIRDNWRLGERWQIIAGSLPGALAALEGQAFDLVYADPPYAAGIAEQIPAWLDAHGIRTARLVIEEAAHVTPQWPRGWTPGRSRRYGGTCLHFLAPEESP